MDEDPEGSPRPTGHGDQHFLVDDCVLDRIVERAPEGGHALEIGGGGGALTDRLVERYETLTVIERDRELADHLRRSYPGATVVEGDATETPLPAYDVCVSNLPYSASSPLLFRLLPRDRPTVLTLQAEVAERLAADVGDDDYGRLSVTAGFYADCEVAERVPPSAFDPPPEVTSAVVTTTPRDDRPEVPTVDQYMDLVRGVFTQRRKTLRNAVANTTHITGIDDADAAVERLPDELAGRRPGRIAPDEYAALARRLHGV